MAFSIDRYSELKAKGLVALVKLGPAYVWSVKQYDSATGQEAAPEVGSVGMPELLKQRETQAAVLAQYDAFIADLKALG